LRIPRICFRDFSVTPEQVPGTGRSTSKLGKQAPDLGVAYRRRRPIDVDARNAARRKISGEFAQADIDHANFGFEQLVRSGFVLP
jgi:hypothetical protein